MLWSFVTDDESNMWHMIARAYTVIRDAQGKELSPLRRFLNIVVSITGIPTPNRYLTAKGCELTQSADGEFDLVRVAPLRKELLNLHCKVSEHDLIDLATKKGFFKRDKPDISVSVSSASDIVMMTTQNSANGSHNTGGANHPVTNVPATSNVTHTNANAHLSMTTANINGPQPTINTFVVNPNPPNIGHQATAQNGNNSNNIPGPVQPSTTTVNAHTQATQTNTQSNTNPINNTTTNGGGVGGQNATNLPSSQPSESRGSLQGNMYRYFDPQFYPGDVEYRGTTVDEADGVNYGGIWEPRAHYQFQPIQIDSYGYWMTL